MIGAIDLWIDLCLEIVIPAITTLALVGLICFGAYLIGKEFMSRSYTKGYNEGLKKGRLEGWDEHYEFIIRFIALIKSSMCEKEKD